MSDSSSVPTTSVRLRSPPILRTTHSQARRGRQYAAGDHDELRSGHPQARNDQVERDHRREPSRCAEESRRPNSEKVLAGCEGSSQHDEKHCCDRQQRKQVGRRRRPQRGQRHENREQDDGDAPAGCHEPRGVVSVPQTREIELRELELRELQLGARQLKENFVVCLNCRRHLSGTSPPASRGGLGRPPSPYAQANRGA